MKSGGGFIRGLAIFTGMMLVFALTLGVMNVLPDFLDSGQLKRHKTVESARKALGEMRVLMPSYFPESMLWPPSEIIAQTKPYTALAVTLSSRNSREPVLVIIESASADMEPFARLRMSRVTEEVVVSVKGRKSILKNGLCGKAMAACSSVSWLDNDDRGGPLLNIQVTALAAPPELLRIAESMMPVGRALPRR